MRRPWPGIFLWFHDKRPNHSIVVTNNVYYSLHEGMLEKTERSITNITNVGHDGGNENGNLGETRMYDGLDASIAPLATKMIDLLAFSKGEKVRESIATKILTHVLQHYHKQGGEHLEILDMGCGIGKSTIAVASAARQCKSANLVAVTGIDVSSDRIVMARENDLDPGTANDILNKTPQPEVRISYREANAEKTLFRRNSFDLITIMYVFHETPFGVRDRILREARRILKPGGLLAVVDISRDYESPPSYRVNSSETYLQEYQQNFKRQILSLHGFETFAEGIVVPGHIVLYTAVKKTPYLSWKTVLLGWKKTKNSLLRLSLFLFYIGMAKKSISHFALQRKTQPKPTARAMFTKAS